MHLFAYGPSIMDADLILGSLYEKTGRLYWIDPQVQDLVQKQRAEADPTKRRAIIGEILKLSAQSLPYAPLYNEIHAYGIQNRVKWLPRPDERLYFQSAEIQ
jgi:ABC-type transport system substrate-binding protein